MAQRHAWSGDDFRRAEAAGLFAFTASAAPEPEAEPAGPARNPHLPQHSRVEPPQWGDPARDMVWWDDLAGEWRTDHAPPPGFAGDEEGEFGDDDYARALAPDEAATMDAIVLWQDEQRRREGDGEREGWFASIRAAMGEGADEGAGADALEPHSVRAEPFDVARESLVDAQP